MTHRAGLDHSRKSLGLSADERQFLADKRGAGIPDGAIALMMGRSVLELLRCERAPEVGTAAVFDLDAERRRLDRLALERQQRKSTVWRAPSWREVT
jgi:hypothetical protein